jgi:hypothetical protein
VVSKSGFRVFSVTSLKASRKEDTSLNLPSRDATNNALQFDDTEPVGKVGVLFAILHELDSAALDTQSLYDAVAKLAGHENARLFFDDGVKGLMANEYLCFENGLWSSTGKGRSYPPRTAK